jgi:DNA adenine methylase
MEPLKAPFPYFGGKSKTASWVWERFGVVSNYVEPFFGSGAILLCRPGAVTGTETVNDLDGLVANFWRAIKNSPNETAEWADNPVNENDLHARHAWLVGQKESLAPRLEGDPEWCDPKIAGWWAWGMCCWIGSGFCSGNGPWHVRDGRLVRDGGAESGVNRKLVNLGDAGRGVSRQIPQLGKTNGVNKKDIRGAFLRDWFESLSRRFRYVRVASGDWSRVCVPTALFSADHKNKRTTAIFLDPPYAETAVRCKDVYRKDNLSVANDVRSWAIEHGDDPRLRIALCGYEGEHEMPDTWQQVAWKAHGGYGNQSRSINRTRERIWFSPHCLAGPDEQQANLL